MTLDQQEYAALRHTIALRGTVRMALVPAVVVGWAALAGWLWTTGSPPLAALLPLLVLAAGFEAIVALHTGVERIGRYLQLRYETDSAGPAWETTAMALGPGLPGGGVDPLFGRVFAGAALVNLMPALTAVSLPEFLVLAATHLMFFERLRRARRAARHQRAADVAELSRVLSAGGSPASRRGAGHAPGPPTANTQP